MNKKMLGFVKIALPVLGAMAVAGVSKLGEIIMEKQKEAEVNELKERVSNLERTVFYE